MARPIKQYKYGSKRTHCLYCGIALAPHKELYCTSECGWRYRFEQRKIKGHDLGNYDSQRGHDRSEGRE